MDLLRLLVGFKHFREKYFEPENALYNRLSTGQNPKTLVIACSDSRVDPAIVTSAAPGELFVVRNIGNLVPPYETSVGLHGISSAIEFAVKALNVENILVMGHRQCGGIRALMTSETTHQPMPGTFMGPWMNIARGAAQTVRKEHPEESDLDTLCKHCEKKSVVASLENLKTFPFVHEAIKAGTLTLIGAYFDLEQGEMFEYNEQSHEFQQIIV